MPIGLSNQIGFPSMCLTMDELLGHIDCRDWSPTECKWWSKSSHLAQCTMFKADNCVTSGGVVGIAISCIMLLKILGMIFMRGEVSLCCKTRLHCGLLTLVYGHDAHAPCYCYCHCLLKTYELIHFILQLVLVQ